MNKGLLPLPKDKRDRSHARTFGAVSATTLPLNGPAFEPLEINQQFESNFCTGEGTSEDGEQVYMKRFSPEYQIMSIYRILGKTQDVGADLRSAMKSGIKYGFLPKEYSPFTLGVQSSDFIADYRNWQNLDQLDAIAAKYKQDGYYAVDGWSDTFDNIRSAQWTACQDINDNKRTVIVGTPWFEEWNTVGKDGIAMMPTNPPVSLHCHLTLTWQTYNGVQYLVNQNSEGPDFGDHGKIRFSREIVNKYFNQGAFLFRKNPDPNQIRTISSIVSIISKIVSLLYKFYPPSPPQEKPIISPINQEPPLPATTKVSKIPSLADGIFEAEGGIKAFGYHINNRGDIKWPVNDPSYVKSLGATHSEGGFSVFPTMAIGDEACRTLCRDAARGVLRSYKSTMTLDEFVDVFAQPPSKLAHDNYIAILLKHLKGRPSQISELL